jgi:ABC-type polar amino acid transport system ATPase subunit
LSKQDAYPSTLSGGQQQRVAIARSLAMQPKVMLLDEVTSALDPETVHEVLDVIKDLAQEGMTMVLVTHEMAFAREVANRIIFMDDGLVLEDAPPATFFANPAHERARLFLEKVL